MWQLILLLWFLFLLAVGWKFFSSPPAVMACKEHDSLSAGAEIAKRKRCSALGLPTLLISPTSEQGIKPFTYATPIMPFLQRVKSTILFAALFPLRALTMHCCMSTAGFICSIAVRAVESKAGIPPHDTLLRRCVLFVIAACTRVYFWALGFMWIEYRGTRAPSSEVSVNMRTVGNR